MDVNRNQESTSASLNPPQVIPEAHEDTAQLIGDQGDMVLVQRERGTESTRGALWLTWNDITLLNTERSQLAGSVTSLYTLLAAVNITMASNIRRRS
jgi:hypothetical protein